MLFINLAEIDGKDRVVISSVPWDHPNWEQNAVIVDLHGFTRQPDAHIAAGVVRNVLTEGGAQVAMEV